MTIEQIIKPRYQVMMTYPNSSFHNGAIIEFEQKGNSMAFNEWESYPVTDKNGGRIIVSKAMLDEFPHIFRPMAWYEKREIKDLPEYVRVGEYVTAYEVIKVSNYEKHWNDNSKGLIIHYSNPKFQPDLNNSQFLKKIIGYGSYPATKQEYENYLLTLKIS